MHKIAVIIPCYKVSRHVLAVINRIGPEVDSIYIVDDFCPENTGRVVHKKCKDKRVKILFHKNNRGVGAAVKTGFLQAIADGATILVKVDGDGQIDPSNVETLLLPLKNSEADYVKGNRFFSHVGLKGMPLIRILGNGALSFFTKLSSGYWHVMDPTNGFIGIHSKVFQALRYEKIDDRFFFETDMLFRLHLIGAVVRDVPIKAKYGNEKSNLRIHSVLIKFSGKHFFRIAKRTIYEYFIQDFNAGSTQLIAGSLLAGSGLASGIFLWIKGIILGRSTKTGLIMIVAILLILGFQLILGALHYDVSNRHQAPIHPYL